MKFAYQSEPGENQWAGTINLVDMSDIIRIEFEESAEKALHVYTSCSIMTIKRADAIKAFRDMFNQYLYQYNVAGDFLPDPEPTNDKAD